LSWALDNLLDKVGRSCCEARRDVLDKSDPTPVSAVRRKPIRSCCCSLLLIAALWQPSDSLKVDRPQVVATVKSAARDREALL
jgi:hypothetical protein